ncbi:unnamed protein product [Bursaphelenchus xylophilus]|uniref:(pine wood nematode) hypothetical protein n=1 Tax=Bursaphelenchus xylophilus TaxID=6326 RepID=A0A1I7RHP3_BURXY|nr:unnamed protein product [Bursaphelenchus xylophilus]CAG9115532.1 unnamed protein product [Bursaphelenchus xylophilus]
MDDGLDVLNNKPTETIENASKNTGCNIYANEGLHVVLDRICTLCHEMYSDTNPNMRSQCRTNCFRNEQFKKCLLVFRPARSLHRRDVLRQNW